jgi:hypothetical protein
MSKIVWSSETGWTDDGPESEIALDGAGRIKITPEDPMDIHTYNDVKWRRGERAAVATIKASDMKVGKTYRYEGDGAEPAGIVLVSKIEREDGELYVTGTWRHEPAWEEDGEGCGVFGPADIVTEVRA